jgi:plasmid stabilization system protein ParE
MANYRLSVQARSQLVDIFDFTERTFGQYQAEAYHAGLERTFDLLADFPRIGQSVDELAARLRRFRFPIAQYLLHGRSRRHSDTSDLSSRSRYQAAALRVTA